MSSSFIQFIHQETDQRYLSTRLFYSMKAIFKEKGALTGVATAGSLTVAKIVTLALSYFCLEGSARSLMVMSQEERSFERLRPLGDVGGWTSLAIFAFLALKDVVEKTIGEGEYLRLKPICQTWLKDHQATLKEDPSLYLTLYKEINEVLDVFQKKCLFTKCLASRQVFAIHLLEETGVDQNCVDKDLKPLFSTIQAELEEEMKLSHYFKRLSEGYKIVKQKNLSMSTLCGVVFPIFLLINVVFSIVGEVGLGKELYIDRLELADTGHFGEWPINAIEALGAAFFLHLWYVINDGDFAITRKIYAKHLNSLKENENAHNQLCEIANEELSQLSNYSNCLQFPSEYKFKKL